MFDEIVFDEEDDDFNINNFDNHFGSFFNDSNYEDDEEYDDDDEVESLRIKDPYTQMKISKHDIYNKKNQALNDIVNQIAIFGQLKSTAGGRIWEYNAEKGCYIPILELEKLVVRCLDTAGCLSELSVKDIKDICMRLLWHPSVQVDADDFNKDEDSINMASGVYNIRTESVKEHSPEYMFTYVINANILQEDEVSCPTFDSFCTTSLAPLQSIDAETAEKIIAQKRQFLLEMIGYALCDSNAGKCALFYKGEPDSGKSVMINFITRLISKDLVSNVPLNHLSDRFNKAELYAKKLNVAGEIKGRKLSEIATFKAVTGSDKIFAEYKGKNPFSFTPRCKMIFAGNTLPGTTETDVTKAFVNRLVVLLFNYSIAKEKQDKQLLDKLWIERDSIFTLAMKALKALYLRNFEFIMPEESKVFLQSFSERENSVHAFLQDCCDLSPGSHIHNVQLLAAYQNYCDRNGLDACGKKQLYEMLSGVPGVSMKKFRIGSENRWGHCGIGLKKNKDF